MAYLACRTRHDTTSIFIIVIVILCEPIPCVPDDRAVIVQPELSTASSSIDDVTMHVSSTSESSEKVRNDVTDIQIVTTDVTQFGNEVTIFTNTTEVSLDAVVTEDPRFALMMELLEAEYYKGGPMGRPCMGRMDGDGHNETLHIRHRYCVCYLSVCEALFGLTLNQEQQKLVADLQAEMDQTIKDNTLKHKYSAEQLPELIGISTSYILIFVVGTIGNILVLVTIARYMGRPTVTNVLIASISAGDMMILLVVLPVQLSNVLYGFWELGDVMCKVVHYLYFVSFACSTLSLLAMSVERYIVICHPMKAQSITTLGRAKKVVIGIWCISGLVAIPIIPISSVSSKQCVVDVLWVSYTFTFYALTVGFVFVLPLLVMLWAYVSVSVALWKSIKLSAGLQHKTNSANGNGNKNDKASEDDAKTRDRIKVIKMLISLVIVFAVCWGPYWGVRLRRAFIEHGKHYDVQLYVQLGKIFQTTAYFNSAINPILYAFASRPFRRGFKRACMCAKYDKSATEMSTSARTYTSGVNPSTSV